MYNVLFADDEPIMRVAFGKMMEEGDARFTLAASVANGAEALSYIRQHPVDIVVTDLKMPVMDGLELIEQLAADGFSGAILVLSNYNDFELVRTALTRGASDYMLKQSITTEKLMQQLNVMVEKITVSDRGAPAPRTDPSTDGLVDAYRNGGVYRPCLLSIRQNAGASPAPLNRIMVVLGQVLGAATTYMSPVAEDKVLLLFFYHAADNEMRQIEDKLRQLLRSIKTYLNLITDALIAPPAATPEMTEQYCAQCMRLFDSQPTSEEPTIRTMEALIFTHFPQYTTYKKEIREALLFIHFHYTDKLSLEDVAKAVNLNPSYLSRLFRQETGEMMFRHINNLRMQKAAQLIEGGCTYMSGVAADVGIDDPFYFARVFKKHHGVPPSEYGKARRR